MSSVVVQFRVDEALKNEASKIYESLGVDLSSAIRTFLKRSITEKGYPFEMNLEEKRRDDANKLLKMFEVQAKIDNIYDMSLDEINDEINKVRAEKGNRWI